MKLYIKQKVFSWKDRFNASDVNGTPVYTVEGEIFSVGKKLHIYDKSGKEAAFIHQKVFSLHPRYFVSVNGEDVAEVVKKFTFLKPEYTVSGVGWEVTGKFSAHSYEILKNGCVIASISKKWMAWSDTFEIDVANDRDNLLALCVVLVIDAVLDAQENADSSI